MDTNEQKDKTHSAFSELSDCINAGTIRESIRIGDWQLFTISELFDVVKGTRLTKANMTEGTIRFIGASQVNNGITGYMGNSEHIHPANTITVNYNGSVGASFYQDQPFWASDDVNVLYPKFKLNKKIALFIIPIIIKVGRDYCFIDKWQKDDMEKDRLFLPAKPNGEPDFDYMERYIDRLQKIVKNKIDTLQELIQT